MEIKERDLERIEEAGDRFLVTMSELGVTSAFLVFCADVEGSGEVSAMRTLGSQRLAYALARERLMMKDEETRESIRMEGEDE